ncbi:MAG: 50S ribosomal protein L17 [Candidatus Kerfeldbacteria bacterium CG_4_10_14_0_8_um_filter_42_10]|uniref:50S ribosomal protein L17 n=1 Tax=Candidatus Kerfeldbacteria bacterium CG_4_10_14_0_8_um_filter_42_10 TaxID=2014248 RepID=A0A2M7RJ12_9BACT|nr:MAG: 50S ribosomal protein L17 [Candidatus Kerfeldbacteria bacterium CG_4_10_14_0_8_um_filter_42_10]
MRHRKKKGILDRKRAARDALLRNLAGQLIEFEKIKTTAGKANILKPIVEKLIHLATVDTIANRRIAKKYLYQEKLIKKLFSEIAPKLNAKKGGYLRISKISNRKGDNSLIVQIEIIKGNETKQS